MTAPLSAELVEELDRLWDFEPWAAECFTIRDKEDHLRKLVLRPLQRAINAAEEEQLDRVGRARSMVLKGRQGGVTTNEQAKSLHACWRDEGVTCLTLAHERDATTKIFEKVTKVAVDNFPSGLLHPLGDREAQEVSFPAMGSFFYTGTAGAKRSGRGLTLKRLHGSEWCFWDKPASILGAVLPGLERPDTVVTLESTASGYGSEAHQMWREAKARGWRPLFFPWWECDAFMYRLPLMAPDELGALDDEEKALVARHGLTLEQIKWRRAKLVEYGRDLFLQEYAEDEESCWMAVGGLFYSASELKALMLRAPTPSLVLPCTLGGTVELFDAQPEGARVIIGSDVSEGVEGDRTTFVARAFTDAWPLLAAYECNTIDPVKFAELLNDWGRRYADAGGPAFLIVEKNAHGITVLRELRDRWKYPLSRIYHRHVQDKDSKERSDRIGWHTSEETKPLLLDGLRVLFTAALEGRAGAPCKGVVRDGFGVRRDPETGRVKMNGRDLLVAEGLAWQARGSVPSIPRVAPLHYS